MTCKPEAVTAYVDGEVDQWLAAEVERHLSVCPICAGQAAFEWELRERLQLVPEPEPLPGFTARLLAVARRETRLTAH